MMETKELQEQLASIQTQLSFITGEIEAQRRTRRELEELKDDLNHIAGEVFSAAVTELDEVAQHVETKDILFLIKKLLRNTRNLTRLMDQMEGIADFAQDAAPITKDLFHEVMTTLDEMDRKQYFEFFSEFVKIVDTVVTSFSIEDVRHLRENIASILSTVKNLTQPEMLSTVNNALGFYKKMDIMVEKDIGYWKILKELRDPETRRGIAFTIQFLKNMAASNGNTHNHNLLQEGAS